MQILRKFCHNKHLTRKRRELQFFSTRNAFITILSSRVILPIKMQKRDIIQQWYFIKTGSYSQRYYFKSKG